MAYYYYRLNAVFGGVPLYIGQTSAEDYKKERPTEEAVWRKIIDLLTDCINEPNLPNKYASGNNDYGRITKGAAYALRGKTYMGQKSGIWRNSTSRTSNHAVTVCIRETTKNSSNAKTSNATK